MSGPSLSRQAAQTGVDVAEAWSTENCSGSCSSVPPELPVEAWPETAMTSAGRYVRMDGESERRLAHVDQGVDNGIDKGECTDRRIAADVDQLC